MTSWLDLYRATGATGDQLFPFIQSKLNELEVAVSNKDDGLAFYQIWAEAVKHLVDERRKHNKAKIWAVGDENALRLQGEIEKLFTRHADLLHEAKDKFVGEKSEFEAATSAFIETTQKLTALLVKWNLKDGQQIVPKFTAEWQKSREAFLARKDALERMFAYARAMRWHSLRFLLRPEYRLGQKPQPSSLTPVDESYLRTLALKYQAVLVHARFYAAMFGRSEGFRDPNKGSFVYSLKKYERFLHETGEYAYAVEVRAYDALSFANRNLGVDVSVLKPLLKTEEERALSGEFGSVPALVGGDLERRNIWNETFRKVLGLTKELTDEKEEPEEPKRQKR